MFITKYQKQYQEWVTGKINILATAKKLGYRGTSLVKGVRKVRKLLSEMGIAIPTMPTTPRKTLRTVV